MMNTKVSFRTWDAFGSFKTSKNASMKETSELYDKTPQFAKSFKGYKDIKGVQCGVVEFRHARGLVNCFYGDSNGYYEMGSFMLFEFSHGYHRRTKSDLLKTKWFLRPSGFLVRECSKTRFRAAFCRYYTRSGPSRYKSGTKKSEMDTSKELPTTTFSP